MLFDQIAYLPDRVPHDAALNMAIDEELLRDASVPVLRTYSWDCLAVSFGYFGKISEIESLWSERQLVRRWTGGGVVPHGEDFTYTLVIPKSSAFASSRAVDSYAMVHELIAHLLVPHVQAPVGLAAAAAPKISGACFENPAQHDILMGTDKVAGAAQRRTQWGLLHQGSIQISGLPSEFGCALAGALAETVIPIALDPALQERAERLADQRYRTDAWLRRF